MPSRRTFLTTGVALSVAASGYLSRLSGASSVNRSHVTTREPVFTNDPDGWQGRPFRAEVYTTPEALSDKLNEDAFDGSLTPEFREFDPAESFVAVFASKLRLTESGRHEGWCPRTELDGDRFVLRVALDEWPAELDAPSHNYVITDRWVRNRADPPTRAAVEVLLTDESDGTRTCSN